MIARLPLACQRVWQSSQSLHAVLHVRSPGQHVEVGAHASLLLGLLLLSVDDVNGPAAGVIAAVEIMPAGAAAEGTRSSTSIPSRPVPSRASSV